MENACNYPIIRERKWIWKEEDNKELFPYLNSYEKIWDKIEIDMAFDFSFKKGKACLKCKNELVACVCMTEDDE